MTRLRTLVITAMLGGAAPILSALHAQVVPSDSLPSTHTVRKGDTLWDLAAQYLGDPRRWTELHALNAALISDPHWIEPGMVLRLVAGKAPAEPEVASAPVTPPAGEAAAPIVPARPVPAARIDSGPRGLDTRSRVGTTTRSTAIRAGDHRAAPYFEIVGGPTGTGRIEATMASGLAASSGAERMVQYRDRVRVRLPQGASGLVGETLLVILLGERVGANAQVVIPAGVVTLVRAAVDGVAEGEVTKMFQSVRLGQSLTLPVELRLPEHVQPLATAFGQVTRVRWIHGTSALGAPGQYLILDATSADGLVPGDQLSLRDEANPDVELGVVQVARVSALGSTAFVLQMRQSGLAVGTRARVSAKMP